jgi:hypothetical protein
MAEPRVCSAISEGDRGRRTTVVRRTPRSITWTIECCLRVYQIIHRYRMVIDNFRVRHLNILNHLPVEIRRCNMITIKREAALRETPTSQAAFASALIEVVKARKANPPDPKAKDALDPYVRERAGHVPMIRPSRSPLLSERAWIEANGY